MQQLTIEQNKCMGISCRVVNVAKPYTTDARPHIYYIYSYVTKVFHVYDLTPS